MVRTKIKPVLNKQHVDKRLCVTHTSMYLLRGENISFKSGVIVCCATDRLACIEWRSWMALQSEWPQTMMWRTARLMQPSPKAAASVETTPLLPGPSNRLE